MRTDPISILLVEDDEDDYILTSYLLKDAVPPFTIDWKTTLESGLTALSQNTYDIAILDMSLPDSTGWETFRFFHAKLPSLPVILMTGLEDNELAIKAVHAGAQSYLVKGSIDTESMVKAIHSAIQYMNAEQPEVTGMNNNRKTTILVVDDDKHLLTTISDFLRFEGYQVLTAVDGKQALAQLATARPDIILLDVMMPGMDGGDVAQAIRAMPAFLKTPIIFTTAVVSKAEARSHDGRIGGESFLAKPFKLDELTARITESLGQ